MEHIINEIFSCFVPQSPHLSPVCSVVCSTSARSLSIQSNCVRVSILFMPVYFAICRFFPQFRQHFRFRIISDAGYCLCERARAHPYPLRLYNKHSTIRLENLVFVFVFSFFGLLGRTKKIGCMSQCLLLCTHCMDIC